MRPHESSGAARGEPVPRSFARRVRFTAGVTALAVGAGLVLVLYPSVPLMGFSAVLGALLLDSAAAATHRYLALPRRVAVVAVSLALLALLAALGWYSGPNVARQMSGLTERVPEALNRLGRALREHGIGDVLAPVAVWDAARLREAFGELWQPIAGAFATVFTAVGGAGLVAVGAFFLALNPRVYVGGALRLVRREARPRWSALLADVGRALRWWLVGRLLSMAIVAVLTIVGLFALGVPLALLLGILAGLLSFIPFLGPVLSAVPAILVGFAESTTLALWIALLYLGVQVIESNFLTPLIEKRVTSLPPAVLLLAELLMGALYGVLGLLVATPLAITLIVFVQALYVRDVLGDPVPLLGTHGGESGRSPEPRPG